VPAAGQAAHGVLACEMARAMCGHPCGLPRRISSLTREGITVAVLDGFAELDQLRTGIWLVDSFIASTRDRVAAVWSPDVSLGRVELV
jgi:hypothetical protein